MRHLSGRRIVTWAALALVAFALAACGGRVNKELLAQASNIPASFDVTLIADKDNQFDYDPNGGTNGAPLTEEDLRSALRYRKEQNLPCATVIVKRGEHGSFLFGENRDDFFACSAYPLDSVFDPTGAGDSFLGGLSGWLAAQGKTKPSFHDLKAAVVHGSVTASFTCEAFSTHKLQNVTQAEVTQRLNRLKAYTDFAA